MSIEKEIPFVIFLKSIYEVRPKKHPTSIKTHHWKLRIETLKSQNDIKRVEFILHNTFPEPLQIKKKSPFEIEEDGFGNFEMQINIKILNRKIPLPYFIHLLPQKVTTIQFHHSVWMVKPKELSKVLEIGGIPMENFENENDEMRALTKILEYVKRHSDRPLDPSFFYPKVYDKVIQKIKRVESSERSSSFMYNIDNDVVQSDDSSSTRQSHGVKSLNPTKHNLFDNGMLDKSKMKMPKTVTDFIPSPKLSESNKTLDFEFKKEMKRKKNQYDSSSESDTNVCSDNIFGSQKRLKKNDNFPKTVKVEDIKIEKLPSNRPSEKKVVEMGVKVENTVKPMNKSLVNTKPRSTDKNNQKIVKDPHKLKLKIKDNSNPDSFNKLFEAQDILVVNRNKTNQGPKIKEEQIVKRPKQESSMKSVERKHSTPVKSVKDNSVERCKKSQDLFNDDNGIKKLKQAKTEDKNKHSMKECRTSNKSVVVNPSMNETNGKSITTTITTTTTNNSNSNNNNNNSSSSNSNNKMKLPEKTMPETKRNRENETTKTPMEKSKKSNRNLFSRDLSRSSSSGSDRRSAFSKSSSDNEIDHDMFKPKKKEDTTKLRVRQLFGDDKSDFSDDDDQADDDNGDIFSTLKNCDKKINNKCHSTTKQRTSSRDKSDDEDNNNSSDNDHLMSKQQQQQHHHHHTRSPSQSPDCQSDNHHTTNTQSTNKGILDSSKHGVVLSYKDRRKLAKQLIKINDKDFFEKLQRLLLMSYRNKEKSLRFDLETMKLDFHMGEISDNLAILIKSMVDEFFEEHHHNRSMQLGRSSSHGF